MISYICNIGKGKQRIQDYWFDIIFPLESARSVAIGIKFIHSYIPYLYIHNNMIVEPIIFLLFFSFYTSSNKDHK